MALSSYAAPKPQRVKLPMVPVVSGSFTSFEPKPTAANYYNTPKTGLPSPLPATQRVGGSTLDNKAAADSLRASGAPASIDYDALIASLTAKPFENIAAQEAAERAYMTDLRRKAIVQFGFVPDDLSALVGDDFNTDITDLTRQQALENTQAGTSTWAAMNKALADATSSYQSSLASRGMLRSGALGQHDAETALSNRQNRYGATNELTDYLSSLWQDYLGDLAAGRTARAQATRDALDLIIAQINAGLGQAPATPPPPAAQGPATQGAVDTIWDHMTQGDAAPYADQVASANAAQEQLFGSGMPFNLGAGGPLSIKGGVVTQAKPKPKPKPYYQSFSGPYGYKPMY